MFRRKQVEIFDSLAAVRTETIHRLGEKMLTPVVAAYIGPIARKGAFPYFDAGNVLAAGYEVAPLRSAEGKKLPAHLAQQLVQPQAERADSRNPGYGEQRNLAGGRITLFPVPGRKRDRIPHDPTCFQLEPELNFMFFLYKRVRVGKSTKPCRKCHVF
jgi:hypothetical protein